MKIDGNNRKIVLKYILCYYKIKIYNFVLK